MAKFVGKRTKRLHPPRNKDNARTVRGEGSRDRAPDAAGGAGYQRRAIRERIAQSVDPLWMSRRNSSRVLGSSRKLPRTADVTVLEFCF